MNENFDQLHHITRYKTGTHLPVWDLSNVPVGNFLKANDPYMNSDLYEFIETEAIVGADASQKHYNIIKI